MPGVRRWLRDESVRTTAASWVVARLAVALGVLAAAAVADELGIWTVQLHQGLFAWDAAFYRDIAADGYGPAEESLRFFPLVPVLARLASVPLLGNVGAALVLVANGAALVAGVLLHRLTVRELDRVAADRAVWLLALLPPATVLVLGYAESVLLACSIGAFLGYRRHRWWAAAALGLLAALARPVGVALVVPAAIEATRPWWSRVRGQGRPPLRLDRRVAARLAAVVGPLAGTGVYLAWVAGAHGDWRLPLEQQQTAELRGGWTNPLATVWDAVDAAASGASGALGEGLHLPWVALYVVLLVVCFRRLPVSYGAYAGALLLVALTGETLGSFERYGLAAFPLVMVLAGLLRPDAAARMALPACAAGLTAFSTLIFLGVFVP